MLHYVTSPWSPSAGAVTCTCRAVNWPPQAVECWPGASTTSRCGVWQCPARTSLKRTKKLSLRCSPIQTARLVPSPLYVVHCSSNKLMLYCKLNMFFIERLWYYWLLYFLTDVISWLQRSSGLWMTSCTIWKLKFEPRVFKDAGVSMIPTRGIPKIRKLGIAFVCSFT